MEDNTTDADKQEDTMTVEHEVQQAEASLPQQRLRALCDQLTKEKEKLLSDLAGVQEELSNTRDCLQKSKEDNETFQEVIVQLEQELYAWKNNYCQEVLLVESQQKEIKELQDKEVLQSTESKKQSEQIKQNEKDRQRMRQQLYKQKILFKSVTKDRNEIKLFNAKLQQDNQQTQKTVENLNLDILQRDTELKLKQEAHCQVKKSETLLLRSMEVTQNKVMCLEQEKMELQHQQEVLKGQITDMKKEREMLRKEKEEDNKLLEKLFRDIEILNKKYLKENTATGLPRAEGETELNLSMELLKYKSEFLNQKTIISKLCKQNEKCINDISRLTDKSNQQLEEIKFLEMKVFKLKETTTETENKLKEKQYNYMVIESELKACTQKLREAEEKIFNLTQKIKILKAENEHLKHEFNISSIALLKSQKDVKIANRKKNALQAQNEKVTLEVKENKELCAKKETEKVQLRKTIAEMQSDLVLKKREMATINKEMETAKKDLLWKDSELSSISDKINTQQYLLDKCKLEYGQRLQDSRRLKLEIMNLSRKKDVLAKAASHVKDLRQENSCLKQELLEEQAKRQAIENELPMNEHRWRRLEANDPSTYELIDKIQALQRLLILKNENVVKKELMLQEKEALCLELQQALARRPGSEAAKQLLLYRQALHKKSRQIKGLEAEVKMYMSKMQESSPQATEHN